METQPVFDGDGKLLYHFRLIYSQPIFRFEEHLSFGYLYKLYYYFFFFNFSFSQVRLGCFNL